MVIVEFYLVVQYGLTIIYHSNMLINSGEEK